jgi:hypothetical protein
LKIVVQDGAHLSFFGSYSRYIDVFQGRAPKGVLAKHHTPQGVRLLREIYDKANLKIL